MTRIPFEEHYKVGAAVGPAYTLPGVCSQPDCDEHEVQRHHLVRRSHLGGAYDWIEYEGVLIQNVVGLCLEHHQLVTENKAWIVWSPLGFFEWVNVDDHDYQFGEAKKLDPHPQVGETPDMSGVYVPDNPEICPTCKRPHRKKTPPEQARNRQKWAIHIPVDERENGADVLDTLLEEARKLMAQAGLAYGDEDNARYYILAAVLGLFVQHGQDVMS